MEAAGLSCSVGDVIPSRPPPPAPRPAIPSPPMPAPPSPTPPSAGRPVAAAVAVADATRLAAAAAPSAAPTELAEALSPPAGLSSDHFLPSFFARPPPSPPRPPLLLRLRLLRGREAVLRWGSDALAGSLAARAAPLQGGHSRLGSCLEAVYSASVPPDQPPFSLFSQSSFPAAGLP